MRPPRPLLAAGLGGLLLTLSGSVSADEPGFGLEQQCLAGDDASCVLQCANAVQVCDDDGPDSWFEVTVPDGKTLIVTATGGEVYANIRHDAINQGGSLTAKGRIALGTDFRAGFMRTHPTETCRPSRSHT